MFHIGFYQNALHLLFIGVFILLKSPEAKLETSVYFSLKTLKKAQNGVEYIYSKLTNQFSLPSQKTNRRLSQQLRLSHVRTIRQPPKKS